MVCGGPPPLGRQVPTAKRRRTGDRPDASLPTPQLLTPLCHRAQACARPTRQRLVPQRLLRPPRPLLFPSHSAVAATPLPCPSRPRPPSRTPPLSDVCTVSSGWCCHHGSSPPFLTSSPSACLPRSTSKQAPKPSSNSYLYATPLGIPSYTSPFRRRRCHCCYRSPPARAPFPPAPPSRLTSRPTRCRGWTRPAPPWPRTRGGCCRRTCRRARRGPSPLPRAASSWGTRRWGPGAEGAGRCAPAWRVPAVGTWVPGCRPRNQVKLGFCD